MKTLLHSIFGILILSTYMVNNASATIHTISVADFSFTPTPLNIKLGDTIRWVWASGVHTTTSTTIPPGAGSWDAPIQSAGQSFTYIPTIEGVYNYVCTIHASMGMGGSFTVIGPSTVNTAADPFFTISPNPATSQIKINTAGLQLHVSVADALGRPVTLPSLSRSNSEQIYSVDHLATGLYVLIIRADENVIIQKLFIE